MLEARVTPHQTPWVIQVGRLREVVNVLSDHLIVLHKLAKAAKDFIGVCFHCGAVHWITRRVNVIHLQHERRAFIRNISDANTTMAKQ